MKREIAEIVIYAIVGATIAPLVGFILANIIVDSTMGGAKDIFSTIVLLLLSFIITYGVRALVAFRMLVNFNSIHIGIVVFFIQLVLCSVLLFTMMIPFLYILAIAGGSFIGLVVTIIKRPVTIIRDADDVIRHADEMKDRVKDHLKDLHDEFRKRL